MFVRAGIIAAFLLVAASAHAQGQQEMNVGACNESKKIEEKMSSIYSKVLEEYASDEVFIKNIKASQQAWLAYRKAEMKALYPERERGYYGSIQPLCNCNTFAYLTESRIKELQQWNEGAEEGDVCAGSVKFKR